MKSGDEGGTERLPNHLPIIQRQNRFQKQWKLNFNGCPLHLTIDCPHGICNRKNFKPLIVSRTHCTGHTNVREQSGNKQTGFKIYGEGEWKMRTHGKQKRRTWRKYHVCIDPNTHEVVAMELTEANVHDSIVVPDLMEGLDRIGDVYADGAYPTKNSLDAIVKAGGRAIIPPRSGTCIVKKNPSPGEQERNRLVRERRKLGGKKKWKQESGYHKRSLVETHMFRLKTTLGSSLKSRDLKNQKVEARIMAAILNKMTSLGMPQSAAIPVH